MPPRPRPPVDATPKIVDHDLAPRLSIPLSKDKGRIAYDKMQDKTRGELRRVLSDPELADRLGVTAPGVTAPGGGSKAFPPELCGVAFDAISMLIVALAKNKQVDRAELLAFTDADKAILNPKAALLLDKYVPNSLGTYQLEMEFGLALLGVIAGKLAILRAQPAPAAVTPATGPTLVPDRSDSHDTRSVNM